jgi:hypothetical protein
MKSLLFKFGISRLLEKINSLLLFLSLALESVAYQQSWLPNMTHITVNVSSQGDFNNIESICKANEKQKAVCSDIITSHSQCSTSLTLIFNSTRGCDYQCLFSTKKQGFDDAHSKAFQISIRK